jgi:hypothetical protein
MEKEFSAIQLLTNPAWVGLFLALAVNAMALIWGAGRLRQQQLSDSERIDTAISDIAAVRRDIAAVRDNQHAMGERVATLEGRMQ